MTQSNQCRYAVAEKDFKGTAFPCLSALALVCNGRSLRIEAVDLVDQYPCQEILCQCVS